MYYTYYMVKKFACIIHTIPMLHMIQQSPCMALYYTKPISIPSTSAIGMHWSMPEWTSVVQVVEHGKSIGPAKEHHNPTWPYSHNDSSVILKKCCQKGSPFPSLRYKMKINTETTDVTVPVRIVATISLWMRLNNMWTIITSRKVVNNNRKHASE